jgi:hypothetical protein
LTNCRFRLPHPPGNWHFYRLLGPPIKYGRHEW